MPIVPQPTRRSARRAAAATPPRTLWATAALFAVGLAAAALGPQAARAADTSAAQQLQRFSTEAGKPGQSERGAAFFNSTHGGEWACASCHGKPPTATGKHASTGKAIDPLAPAFNAKGFTTEAKVDKWFRRNCNDVVKRECSAIEKADVMAYLLQLKP